MLSAAAAVPAMVALLVMTGELCAAETCSLQACRSVALQLSSKGAPCAVLRSATALQVGEAAGRQPPASALPVSASDADGCPAAAVLLPALGSLLAVTAGACGPDSLGIEPAWAASARLPVSSAASVPAAAIDAWAAGPSGMLWAAGD